VVVWGGGGSCFGVDRSSLEGPANASPDRGPLEGQPRSLRENLVGGKRGGPDERRALIAKSLIGEK